MFGTRFLPQLRNMLSKLNQEIVSVDSTLFDSKKVASLQGTTAIHYAKEQRFMLRSAQIHIILAWVVGPGDEYDNQKFEQVVSSIRINIGRGIYMISLIPSSPRDYY
jgi:hypothetical protein